MTTPAHEARWRLLEAEAAMPEAQEVIREEIRRGTIRVVPARGGGIRIIPNAPATGEPPSTPDAGSRRPAPDDRPVKTRIRLR